MSNIVEMEILGEPASKANSRKIVMFGKRPAIIKSQKARDYVKSFAEQASQVQIDELLEGDLWIELTIYYASRRPDLDESVVLDCLQGIAYTNDRQIKEKHVYHDLDKTNPRTKIKIGKLDRSKNSDS
jgi:Holliday junction resolvase RusA-like endonuclease